MTWEEYHWSWQRGWVLLLGVAVGVVRAQDDAAFLVLDDNKDPDPNDFDPAVLADSRGRAVEAFENLQKSGGTLSRETFADDPNTPPAYLAKVSGATALQKESQSRQDNSLTASSVLTSPAAERLAVEARPAAIYPCHYYKPQYHCDHQTYILTYFPLGNYAICFIPWASEQRITYVRCRQVPSLVLPAAQGDGLVLEPAHRETILVHQDLQPAPGLQLLYVLDGEQCQDNAPANPATEVCGVGHRSEDLHWALETKQEDEYDMDNEQDQSQATEHSRHVCCNWQ
nr:hypothetical protein BaRGS_024321 [Batillaria attramentaria]